MRKKDKHKNIYYAKMLSTNWLLIFIVILMICIAFAYIYINDQISYQRTVDKNIQAQIDNIMKSTTPTTEDSLLIDYYRELSNKTDEAINRILVIVGIIATIITLFGLFFAFKAPHDIEKQIDELKNELEAANEAAEDVKYQAEVASALLDSAYHKKIERITNVIKDYPNRPEAYNYRGQLKSRINQYDSALSDFEMAYKFGLKNHIYYNNTGAIYNCKEDYKKAITCFNKSIEEKSNQSSAYANRGYAHFQIGEYEKALCDYEEAIDYNPDIVLAYVGCCKVYRELVKNEKDAEMIKYYESKIKVYLDKAYELDPDDAYVKKHRKN